jgi:carbamoyl-phosphate synthase large subunit
MRSTGEVLGLADSFGLAFYKAEEAAQQVPAGAGFCPDHRQRQRQGRGPGGGAGFHKLGFTIKCTRGTRAFLDANGVPSEALLKMHEGRPHIIDAS